MFMSKLSNKLFLLMLFASLAACQSVPETGPQPEPTVQAEPVTEPETPLAEPETPLAEPETPVAEPGTAAADQPEPAPAPEPVDFNQQFYDQAIDLLKSGKTELALELLKQVSSDAPDKPYIFTNLGLAYFKLEKSDLAEKAFSEAIERDDDDAVAHNHVGILLRQKGEFEAARQHYQKAIDADSSYALAYLNLGILFDIYLQDLQKALQHYQKYQSLAAEENARVSGWIIDIERRLKSSKTSS